jgi:GNAT superfamily N-acetyltransferase
MSPAPDSALAFHEVIPERWVDFEQLFLAPGGPKHCWCMVPRRAVAGAEGKRDAMHSLVEAGTPVGILAYRDGTPIGWCSIAPKATHPRLVRHADEADLEGVWSLTSFFVPRAERGRGLLAQLLDAALEVARAQGARAVEAYPVDEDSPSYRYGGFVQNFARAGFPETGRLGTRRHVVQRDLPAG